MPRADFAVKLEPPMAIIGRRLTRLEKQIYPQAMASAINQTLDQVRTSIVKQLGQRMNVKAKLIRARARTRKARQRNLKAHVWMGLKPIALMGRSDGERYSLVGKSRRKKTLKAGRKRARAKGVRAAGRVFPGTFLATMPGGHVNVFRRKANWRHRGEKRHGLPIEKVTIAFPNDSVRIMDLETRIGRITILPRILRHELGRRSKKLGRR